MVLPARKQSIVHRGRCALGRRQQARIDARARRYPGYPHGMLTTHADVINSDLLAFIRA